MFIKRAKESGGRVEHGIFQAHMEVDLINDYPVTILIDSDKTFNVRSNYMILKVITVE